MSPWRHIPKASLTPAMREALTIINRRWVIVWLLSVLLLGALPWWLNARQTNTRLDVIQKERTYNIVRNCQDTNKRREAAFRTLDSVLASALAQHPERMAQIRASRQSTRLLINALVPHQDCKQLGSDRVSK